MWTALPVETVAALSRPPVVPSATRSSRGSAAAPAILLEPPERQCLPAPRWRSSSEGVWGSGRDTRISDGAAVDAAADREGNGHEEAYGGQHSRERRLGRPGRRDGEGWRGSLAGYPSQVPPLPALLHPEQQQQRPEGHSQDYRFRQHLQHSRSPRPQAEQQHRSRRVLSQSQQLHRQGLQAGPTGTASLRHPADVIHARHSLARALAGAADPDELLLLFRQGLGCSQAPVAVPAADPAPPLQATGSTRQGARAPGCSQAQAIDGASQDITQPVLLDPVCISAAVCRMARLCGREGLQRDTGGTQRAAGAAPTQADRLMRSELSRQPAVSQQQWLPQGQYPFSQLRRVYGPESEVTIGSGFAGNPRQPELERARKLTAFFDLASAAIRRCAAAAMPPVAAGDAVGRRGQAFAGALPPRPFRPREVANIVWGLSCLRAADSCLGGSAAVQELLLGLAADLLPPPPAARGATRLNDAAGAAAAGVRCGTDRPSGGRAGVDGSAADSRGTGSTHSRGGIVSGDSGCRCSGGLSTNATAAGLPWRPGELTQLSWGMAHAGVLPPSRAWLLSYLAAWDERTIAAAAPSELAVLAWTLAEWHRKSGGAAAWARGMGGPPDRGNGAGARRLRRAAALGAGGVVSLLPRLWLRRFWAVTLEHLYRTAASSLRRATSEAPPNSRGDARRSWAPLLDARAGLAVRRQQQQHDGPLRFENGGTIGSLQYVVVSGATAAGAVRQAKTVAPGAAVTAGPLFSPGELGMLLWSLSVLRLLPPRPWLEAALRAAATAAPAAQPLALATTLLGAARLGRMTPAPPAINEAGGTANSEGAPQQSTTGMNPASECSSGSSCPTGPRPLTAEGVGGLPPRASVPPPLPVPRDCLLAPPTRPRPPPPAPPCPSLLAAFSRCYLRRCAAALASFGPSQVVDLLAAVRALSGSGHLPPPAAMPLPLPSLLDAAAARLQRCYEQGLGPRHLAAAAGHLAALRHAPPPEWVDWWMDEMYGTLVRRRLRARELASVLRVLTAFGRAPGPVWSAAALTAAGGPVLRHASRGALTDLAEALAEAGVRLDVAGLVGAASSGASGAASHGGPPLLESAMRAATASTAHSPGELAPPPAGLAARRAWLRRFLWVWADRYPRRFSERWRRHVHARRGSPMRPTAEQANRLVAALTLLAYPPATWPSTLRAALALAVRGEVLTRGLRAALVDRKNAQSRRTPAHARGRLQRSKTLHSWSVGPAMPHNGGSSADCGIQERTGPDACAAPFR